MTGHFENGRWVEDVDDIPYAYITIDTEKMKITPIGNGKYLVTITKEGLNSSENPNSSNNIVAMVE